MGCGLWVAVVVGFVVGGGFFLLIVVGSGVGCGVGLGGWQGWVCFTLLQTHNVEYFLEQCKQTSEKQTFFRKSFVFVNILRWRIFYIETNGAIGKIKHDYTLLHSNIMRVPFSTLTSRTNVFRGHFTTY